MKGGWWVLRGLLISNEVAMDARDERVTAVRSFEN
jgi:hypothetical protein